MVDTSTTSGYRFSRRHHSNNTQRLIKHNVTTPGGDPCQIAIPNRQNRTNCVGLPVWRPANYTFILQGGLPADPGGRRDKSGIFQQRRVSDRMLSELLDSPEAPALCGPWGWTRWQSNRNACSRCWREPRPPSGSRGQSGGCRRGRTPGTDETKSS